MLTIQGPSHRAFCDGVSRRDFLRIGGLALGGLSLPGLLRAEAAAAVRGRAPASRQKSVIMVFLADGVELHVRDDRLREAIPLDALVRQARKLLGEP